MKVIAVEDYEEMSRLAAEIIQSKVQSVPNAVLGFATGGTPIGTYKQLVANAKERHLSFRMVRTVNLDEYVGISAEHPESYHSYMKKHVFEPLGILPENCHLPDGEAEDLVLECERYEKVIEQLGEVELQVLGIGQNGHIGFNEPMTPFSSKTHVVELTASTLTANASYFLNVKQPTHAITMGIGTILKSREILLLASGESKRLAVNILLEGKADEKVPATALITHPNVTIIADYPALGLKEEGNTRL
ncbi:glucosamine-6-phosphate deaminase [Fictibacillus iocasae]|uniref:Glucosamine-6-phosphate deaminase n=1 Tax=Fictibacillus iocasae TaxID=2715437 RepID=A0ABW2NVJ3_9BACL